MTSRKRNFASVIDRMLTVVPPDEELARWLEKARDDSYYNPPECRYVDWGWVGEMLYDRFPTEPTEGWEKAVCDIFTAKDVVEDDYV